MQIIATSSERRVVRILGVQFVNTTARFGSSSQRWFLAKALLRQAGIPYKCLPEPHTDDMSSSSTAPVIPHSTPSRGRKSSPTTRSDELFEFSNSRRL